MKIKKVSTFHNLIIRPTDGTKEKQKMIYGEYNGAIGLMAWLWCDPCLTEVMVSADNECTSYLFNEKTFTGVRVTISGDERLIEQSVKLFLENCEL